MSRVVNAAASPISVGTTQPASIPLLLESPIGLPLSQNAFPPRPPEIGVVDGSVSPTMPYRPADADAAATLLDPEEDVFVPTGGFATPVGLPGSFSPAAPRELSPPLRMGSPGAATPLPRTPSMSSDVPRRWADETPELQPPSPAPSARSSLAPSAWLRLR